MTEQSSPWATPDTQTVIEPVTVPASPSSAPAEPLRRREERAAAGYASGRVGRSGTPPVVPPPDLPDPGRDGDDDPVRSSQRILKWLGGGAILVVAIGL